VFQVHGVDERGKVVVIKRLRRKDVLNFFANLLACVVACLRARLSDNDRTRR